MVNSVSLTVPYFAQYFLVNFNKILFRSIYHSRNIVQRRFHEILLEPFSRFKSYVCTMFVIFFGPTMGYCGLFFGKVTQFVPEVTLNILFLKTSLKLVFNTIGEVTLNICSTYCFTNRNPIFVRCKTNILILVMFLNEWCTSLSSLFKYVNNNFINIFLRVNILYILC